MTAGDHYMILGLARGATDAEIKSAWRRAARMLHPDMNPGDPQAAERFHRARLAYEVLSDASRRADYDFQKQAPTAEPSHDARRSPSSRQPRRRPQAAPPSSLYDPRVDAASETVAALALTVLGAPFTAMFGAVAGRWAPLWGALPIMYALLAYNGVTWRSITGWYDAFHTREEEKKGTRFFGPVWIGTGIAILMGRYLALHW